MKLIVGLGNPGSKFATHRHNMGFQTLDRFAGEHGLRFIEKRARAQVARGVLHGEEVVLAKPQTYMNLSGESVRALVKGLGVKLEDVLIVSDDLDLAFGKVRLRAQGSHGGHNGLRSVIAALGTNTFPRLRLGV